MSGGDGGRGEERESEREVRSVSVSQTMSAKTEERRFFFLNSSPIAFYKISFDRIICAIF